MEKAEFAKLAEVNLAENTNISSTGYQGVRRDQTKGIPAGFQLIHGLKK